jgi:hypothetical protein
MTAEDRKLVARMKEIRELIKEFGLTLCGYDPGISAYVDARPNLKASAWNGPFKLGEVEWAWLEPLLQELKILRRTKQPDTERLIAWMTDPNRKSPELAFTDGPERQVAYFMQMAMVTRQQEIEQQRKKRK